MAGIALWMIVKVGVRVLHCCQFFESDLSSRVLHGWHRVAKTQKITSNLFDLGWVLLYIGDMRQGTGHPVGETEVIPNRLSQSMYNGFRW